jgi:hypothetical protein
MRTHRWAAIATGTLLLVALLGFAPRGTAHAAQASQQWAGGSGNILGIASGGGSYSGHIRNFEAPTKCLDVPGGAFYSNHGLYNTENDASGAQVQLWDCEPGDVQHDYDRNQTWSQQDNGNGSWTYFVTGAQNFCLDSQGSQSAGSPVVVNPCSNSVSQEWTIGPNGELQSWGSGGYCADIDQATFQGDGNGAQVVLLPCGAQENPPPAVPGGQNWFTVSGAVCTAILNLAGGCIGHFHNTAAQTKCLDIPGYRFFDVSSGPLDIYFDLDATGTQVQLWDCEPADGAHGHDFNQIWFQQANADGSLTYHVDGYVHYCLDSQGIQSAGSAVVVNPCNGGNSQEWDVGPAGQLESVASAGYCADINPATFQGDGNGAQVVLEPCVGLASALYPAY